MIFKRFTWASQEWLVDRIFNVNYGCFDLQCFSLYFMEVSRRGLKEQEMDANGTYGLALAADDQKEFNVEHPKGCHQ